MKLFKSNAFKCVVVMLSVILLCGGLLAVLSDLLKVSDTERIQRSIDKIYGAGVTEIEQVIDADYKTDFGEIKSCYKLKNGDYLVQSTGKKGYSNGTVTLDISITIVDGTATVKKAVLNGYTSQTLMSQLTSLYNKFANVNSTTVGDVSVVTGASMSSTAGINAVKTAIDFINRLGG
ncbi:MAG: hypothetical protein J6V68_05680 [Clostridia bacterium]|nr:hypothetical protein [Clostridia bacterium]